LVCLDEIQRVPELFATLRSVEVYIVAPVTESYPIKNGVVVTSIENITAKLLEE